MLLHSSDSSPFFFFFPHLELVSQALCSPNMLTLPLPPASVAGIHCEDKGAALAGLQAGQWWSWAFAPLSQAPD